MEIDERKARVVFGRLLAAYSRKEHPFDQPKATSPAIPENLPRSLGTGTREHALFLFMLCYWMRGGIKSHTATRQLSRLYENNPGIFVPEFASPLTVDHLTAEFRGVGLGFNAEEIAGIWIGNLVKIADEWNCDPRTLFDGIATYEEACERIQNRKGSGFRGFQKKMVSMLTYFYMDSGIIDPWHFPIPVDFHALRIVFAHELVVAHPSEANGSGFYTEPVRAAVRNLFHRYCVEYDVNPLRLCDAVWLFSGLMCNQHPGNKSDVGGRHGRKTEIWPVKRWTAAQTQTYERTCAVCPIRQTCHWCVPSAEYYIRGRITLRERRDEPPQLNLFSNPLF
ncbi:MAG: hypothetical protein HYS43_00545 [Candidatus Liptonbacteria bacterium]|nr:hypothetical protein [Candidatus Liptonbacteria bacterium]